MYNGSGESGTFGVDAPLIPSAQPPYSAVTDGGTALSALGGGSTRLG